MNETAGRDAFLIGMRRVKELTVKDSECDNDLSPMIQVDRNGIPAVTALFDGDFRDLIMFAFFSFACFGADEVMFCFESYCANAEVNPETGEAWDDSDMQYLFESNPEAAKGVVNSAITFLHLTRNGQVFNRSEMYETSGDVVTWADNGLWLELTQDDGLSAAAKEMSETIPAHPMDSAVAEEPFRSIREQVNDEEWLLQKDMKSIELAYSRFGGPPDLDITLCSLQGSERSRLIAETDRFSEVKGDKE